MVTGGHGFIGSHVLVQLVDAGHEVACFDVRGPSAVAEPVADGYRFLEGDVTDAADVFDAVARFDPDRVVHLASLLGRPSERDPRGAFSVNVDGTLNVLEAADTHDVERVVAASSTASYGPSTGDRLTEATPQTPESVYGLTKYAVERVGRTYRDRRGIGFAAMELNSASVQTWYPTIASNDPPTIVWIPKLMPPTDSRAIESAIDTAPAETSSNAG